jgi:hypothetical protein
MMALLGLVSTASAAEGRFLYRCLTLDKKDHFVSPSEGCEGDTLEQNLGCTAAATGALLAGGHAATAPLLRCYDGAAGDHMVSVGTACDVGYVLEQQLGSAFVNEADVVPGDALPLYRCRTAEGDHFETHDPRCEGQRVEAQLGFLSSVCAAPAPTPPPAPPPSIVVPGLPWPQGLQGHDDENWPTRLFSTGQHAALQQRYARLAALKPGIRRYNMFWSAFESAQQPSSAAPKACPPGFEPTPPNATEAARLGYHRFHCMSSAQLATFDAIFAMDRAIGAQNAAILYSAPAWARHPNCTGFVFGKDVIKGGCLPSGPTALDDFEDFVNMLGARWGRSSGNARLSHFVVWNEVASAGWMDASPALPNRAGAGGASPLSEAQLQQLVGMYAALMRRTAAAVARHYDADEAGAMIWGSFDRLWDRPGQAQGAVLHVGSKPFLDRLWPLLRTDFAWSLAVHPYDDGDPRHAQMGTPPAKFTFADLGRIVAYQQQQLAAEGGRGGGGGGTRASIPNSTFSLLYASEQGWPSPACCDDDIRARNICYAQELAARVPSVVGVTHNYFQDNPGGSEQGGQDYGLVAGNITANFSNAAGYPTWQAYVATSAPRWGKDSGHFCCTKWHVGCAAAHT